MNAKCLLNFHMVQCTTREERDNDTRLLEVMRYRGSKKGHAGRRGEIGNESSTTISGMVHTVLAITTNLELERKNQEMRDSHANYS